MAEQYGDFLLHVKDVIQDHEERLKQLEENIIPPKVAQQLTDVVNKSKVEEVTKEINTGTLEVPGEAK